jgi:hypothetical protein
MVPGGPASRALCRRRAASWSKALFCEGGLGVEPSYYFFSFLLLIGLRLLLLRLLCFRLLGWRCWAVRQPHLVGAGFTAVDHLRRQADPTSERRHARAAFAERRIGEGHEVATPGASDAPTRDRAPSVLRL